MSCPLIKSQSPEQETANVPSRRGILSPLRTVGILSPSREALLAHPSDNGAGDLARAASPARLSGGAT